MTAIPIIIFSVSFGAISLSGAISTEIMTAIPGINFSISLVSVAVLAQVCPASASFAFRGLAG